MKIDSDSYLGSNIFVGQAIYSIKTCLLRKTISNRRVLNNNVNIFISNILWTTHFGINRTLLIMHYELCIEKAHGCVISPRRGSAWFVTYRGFRIPWVITDSVGCHPRLCSNTALRFYMVLSLTVGFASLHPRLCSNTATRFCVISPLCGSVWYFVFALSFQL